MRKTIDGKFDYKEAIEGMFDTLVKVRNHKIRHPELKMDFSMSYGGVLNAYREGDLTFKQAIGYLKQVK